MVISDFLSRPGVLVNVRTKDKNDLIEALARVLAPEADIPANHVIAELLKREELGSTGMGDGVAIPHARFQEIKKPIGVMAKLKPPIDFDAIDGQPVDLVFVLLLPATAEGEQLGALACAARKLRSPDALTRLRRAKSADELYEAVTG